ncbi:MAG: hypothetical protein K0S01_408 [Herbinix sp.]|jgi:hypothetical protein|nr:hypothetical protein [Herbinix sp.]
MKKLRLILLSIVLLGFMIGCHKVDMTNTDKERIEFVKDTILRYGMEIVTEVTQDTLEENNKSTDDIVSFGKKQIYELSCDLDTNSLFYHKFESSKGGKEEAEKLFSELRDSIKVLPDSTIEEKTDTETGNKSFTSRSKLTNSTETIDTLEDDDIANDKALYAEILIVLIYDAAKYEVAVMTSQVKSPSDSIDTMINIEMMDMEWTY